MKIGDKEVELKKIKGDAALDLLAIAGEPDKRKEVLELQIKYGSDAKYKELDVKEITNLILAINEFNGFTEDFTVALGKKSGK